MQCTHSCCRDDIFQQANRDFFYGRRSQHGSLVNANIPVPETCNIFLVLQASVLRNLSDAHETCMFMHKEDRLMQPSLSLHSCSHVQTKHFSVTCCKACK
ncbi:TPA: hypothetical protein ACH3X1_002051 [Trebouxia sp. C0004]